ncbi:dihydrofolate reductase family protein [Nocardioides daeguensis]|uniref:Dihydrofolate reductase family protein n=1 Tax=Nocardioides daeguensis TaxID=908359 RepID=A0ABP6VEJ1_9ACTN|nr:dihydrofolate reductase [Nocardioides daeguensis]MBV6729367.1 dihydrofolate reductase [Nocardioides daeguensis]MCR1771860.1 dihydrofolate reductase [Nocardioides daeguensis]
MPALTYYVGVTLDGFIAGPRDEVDFFGLSDDFLAFLADEYADLQPTHLRAALGATDAPLRRYDTVVMGRRTYDPALVAGIADPYAHLRTVVVSTSLPAADGPVEITAEPPLDVVRRLKATDSPYDVCLAGGGRLAGAVSAEIDRLVVKKYPVVAGDGVRMLTRGFAPEAFGLEDVRTFDNGCAVLEYVRQ